MRRSAPLVSVGTVVLLVVVLFAFVPEAPAQDSDPSATATYAFPTVPTFQIPGDIQTPGEQQTATGIATVKPEPTPTPEPRSIRVIAEKSDDKRISLGKGVAVELILDTSGSMLDELEPGRTRIEVAKEVMSGLVRETLPEEVPVALRILDAEGETVGTGFVNGSSVKVSAGTYSVEVETEPTTTFENVVVEGGKKVTLRLKREE